MTREPALSWASLTKRRFDHIDRERAVVVVTCSPLEVHGPHLPMGADALQGEALAERALARLPEAEAHRPILKLPLLFVASDVVAQPGSLAFRPATTVRLLTELAGTLAAQGFGEVVVSNFHGGQRHVLAIERACELGRRRHGVRMTSLFSVMRHAMRTRAGELVAAAAEVPGVDPEHLRGDTHGGLLETALLLALHGPWVEPDYAALPRRTAADWIAEPGPRPARLGRLLHRLPGIREMDGDFQYFRAHSYSGAPAGASAELGERLLGVLAEAAAAGLAEVLAGRVTPEACHAPAWKRWLLLPTPMLRLTTALLGQRSPIARP